MADFMNRQVPKQGEIFLDHVGWFVNDIDAASITFEHLGFPLTPYSVHGDVDPNTGKQRLVGSANRLAMLKTGYLEILTPLKEADTPVSRHMHDCLSRHIGVHLAAFTVADAQEEASRQREAGFQIMSTTEPSAHNRG